MNNKLLDSLIASGTIHAYAYENYDEDGNLGRGKYRNTECLILTFPDGRVLRIDTICSGCAENTSLIIS